MQLSVDFAFDFFALTEFHLVIIPLSTNLNLVRFHLASDVVLKKRRRALHSGAACAAGCSEHRIYLDCYGGFSKRKIGHHCLHFPLRPGSPTLRSGSPLFFVFFHILDTAC